VIRQATNKDLPAIRRLMEAQPGFRQDDWSDATLAKGIETAGDLALVSADNTAVVGFACAHDLGFRAYLSELIVAQEARGRGIGKKLIERIQVTLALRGCRIFAVEAFRIGVLGSTEPASAIRNGRTDLSWRTFILTGLTKARDALKQIAVPVLVLQSTYINSDLKRVSPQPGMTTP
jgi:GNAT superfamily N-acetyltransferase